MKWLFRLFKVVLLASILGFVMLLAPLLYFFERFDQEVPVAQLTFTPVGEQRYRVTLVTGDVCIPQQYELAGDQFQLDVDFIKPTRLANLLGVDSMYRLERLSGRYHDITQQRTRPMTYIDLTPEIFPVLDPFQDNALNTFLVDTRFGSSVYDDIDPGLIVTVYKTEDALIAKSRALVQRGADGVPVIEVTRACGGG